VRSLAEDCHAFSGTKFATSTQLSQRVLAMFLQGRLPELPETPANGATAKAIGLEILRALTLVGRDVSHDGREHRCLTGSRAITRNKPSAVGSTQRMEDAGPRSVWLRCHGLRTLIWGLKPVEDPATLVASDGPLRGRV